VGNFKSGFINIYNPATGKFLGQLKDPDGEPIHIDHLWARAASGGGLVRLPTRGHRRGEQGRG
jgi:hypothetical protein